MMTDLTTAAARLLKEGEDLATAVEAFMAARQRDFELEQAIEDADTDEEQSAAEEAQRDFREEDESWRSIQSALYYFRKHAGPLRTALSSHAATQRSPFASVAQHLVASAPKPAPAPPLPPFVLSKGQQADMDEIAGV